MNISVMLNGAKDLTSFADHAEYPV